MNEEPEYSTLEEWIASKPPHVQAACRKYPPGSIVTIHNKPHWILGYGEYDDNQVGLKISPIDPLVNYDEAIEQVKSLCPHELVFLKEVE